MNFLISKVNVKMNLRIKNKNHVADREKEFLTKSISKPYGRTTAMPTVRALIEPYFISMFNLQLYKMPLKLKFRDHI